MGCNCKTRKHIINIHKKYGHKVKSTWSEHASFHLKESVKILIALILCVIFSPIIVLILLMLIIKGKTTINIKKLLDWLLKCRKNE